MSTNNLKLSICFILIVSLIACSSGSSVSNIASNYITNEVNKTSDSSLIMTEYKEIKVNELMPGSLKIEFQVTTKAIKPFWRMEHWYIPRHEFSSDDHFYPNTTGFKVKLTNPEPKLPVQKIFYKVVNDDSIKITHYQPGDTLQFYGDIGELKLSTGVWAVDGLQNVHRNW